MPTKKIIDSPAVQLMSLLWDNSQKATGHSWLRLNQGLYEGLILAVKIGLEFREGDINEIAKRFNGGYWFGCNFEMFYNCAITFSNRSAWKAYEAHTKRTPFIWTPATLPQRWGGGGSSTLPNPPRLAVGAQFQWKGEDVSVTSFNDEKGYLVAQSYTRTASEDCETCGRTSFYPKYKTLHRYTITHEDLKAEKKRLKKESSAV